MLRELSKNCYKSDRIDVDHINWLDEKKINLLSSYLNLLNTIKDSKIKMNKFEKDEKGIIYYFNVDRCYCFDFSIGRDKIYVYGIGKLGSYLIEVPDEYLSDVLSYMIKNYGGFDECKCLLHSKEKEKILNGEKNDKEFVK